MRTVSVTQRAMAVSLAFVLVSCSAARPPVVGPTGPRDLARYVIVLERRADGQVEHAWIPLKEFDPTKFQHAMSTMNVRRDIVRVSSSGLNAYCEGRRAQCEQDCLKSGGPFAIGRRKYLDTRGQPWRIARGWWCPENCMDAFVECTKGRGEWAEEYAAEFDAVEPAIDWLKKHRMELAVGTVVVIAGVAFAVVVAGSGGAVLVLTPLLVMAERSPGMLSEIQLAEVCR
ncbi:hypothetical protein [Cystobacter ferrugineus]|nr:hypothetical protein [Cystobacter ferrugineus]